MSQEKSKKFGTISRGSVQKMHLFWAQQTKTTVLPSSVSLIDVNKDFNNFAKRSEDERKEILAAYAPKTPHITALKKHLSSTPGFLYDLAIADVEIMRSLVGHQGIGPLFTDEQIVSLLYIFRVELYQSLGNGDAEKTYNVIAALLENTGKNIQSLSRPTAFKQIPKHEQFNIFKAPLTYEEVIKKSSVLRYTLAHSLAVEYLENDQQDFYTLFDMDPDSDFDEAFFLKKCADKKQEYKDQPKFLQLVEHAALILSDPENARPFYLRQHAAKLAAMELVDQYYGDQTEATFYDFLEIDKEAFNKTVFLDKCNQIIKDFTDDADALVAVDHAKQIFLAPGGKAYYDKKLAQAVENKSSAAMAK